MLTVWGRRNSSNVQKVLWLVGELGLDYRHEPAGGPFGRLDEPAFRRLNPHGRVPVIEDDDLVVWESHAILRYLAARYGDGRLWPAAPQAQSQVDKWIEWAQTALLPTFVGGIFWGYYRTPEAQRDHAAIRSSLAACGTLMGLLDSELTSRPFVAGDIFTLADIAAGSMFYRYYGLDIERPDLPNVAAWYARLQDRPAYREHVMVPFDDLKGRLSF
ncbi:glutathione S-transferase family protein [Phenylobacterium montanum]|uniref:Glutathione S-transferase family protein n=1 Tax=Phenylobacterium montanum TaxID=2823693 RepID=A0A975IVP8_9CAUL|nr:glutathione S-transferase family protein [Caulobacter sp. S6]QUD89237.1 glutathione S-transferase family protein [Caulobacter sp. S6]